MDWQFGGFVKRQIFFGGGEFVVEEYSNCHVGELAVGEFSACPGHKRAPRTTKCFSHAGYLVK